jgi:hypothetical protein
LKGRDEEEDKSGANISKKANHETHQSREVPSKSINGMEAIE